MGFDIGLTGLTTAQGAIDIIGTNMANAATAGYHRQEPVIASLDMSAGKLLSVGGSQITAVRQSVDKLLELEIGNEQTGLSFTNEQLEAMQSVESMFGDMSTDKLDAAVGKFFESMQQLSAQPDSTALQEQTVWDADSMTKQFHTLASFLTDIQASAQAKLPDLIDQANSLIKQISDLNNQMMNLNTNGGGAANMVRDQRNEAVQELSKLASVQVVARKGDEAVDVFVWGVPVISSASSSQLSSGENGQGQLTVSVGANGALVRNPDGGQIGGLLSVHNDVLKDLSDHLDLVSQAIMAGVNELHAQATNASGPFTQLTGQSVPAGTLASWNTGMTAGKVYVRVTDQTTGAVTRTAIDIDPATDTLASVAAKISGVTHLTATVTDSSLHIQADNNFAFDFMPTLAEGPYSSTLHGTAAPTISGQFTGSSNDLFTCTVKGTGDASVTDGLNLEVTNQAGQVIRTLNVGKGYASGDVLDLGSGIHVTLSGGSLQDGDTFTIQALADSDETGFLASAGVNAFFTGDSAGSIAVRADLLADPRLLAGNMANSSDGSAVQRMAAVGDTANAALGDLSPRDYVRQIITGIGQQVAGLKDRQDGQQAVLNMLQSQQEDVSGVDINEEAAKLLMFQRMFQAMAKFITTQDDVMQMLFQQIQ